MTALLLDTCAIIFIAENRPIASSAEMQIRAASGEGGIFVSPVSAWEIGLLVVKRGFVFFPDAKVWFHSFLANAGVRLTPLTPEAAIASSFLPPLHGDPADRLLIATARALGVPIVTRDQRILDYAQTGLVNVIVC